MEIGISHSFRLRISCFLSPSLSCSSITILSAVITSLMLCFVAPIDAAAGSAFRPVDEILISCGAKRLDTAPDGRIFKNDHDAMQYLNSDETILASVPNNIDGTSPIYSSARIFHKEATYSFKLEAAGWHWLRLHFYPLKNPDFDLQKASFTVTTNKYVLLQDYKINSTEADLKEYLIDATEPDFAIHLRPMSNSVAFINAIELVSAPDALVADQGSVLFPVGTKDGLTKYGYQVVHRLNMGGPTITPGNDTLRRTWVPDQKYLKQEALAENASIATSAIKYPAGTSPLIAPATVYATAQQMAVSNTVEQNFNVSWNMEVDPDFSYLVRLHFADIVSKAMNDLYFNVYISGKMAISSLDLSSITGNLASAYCKDVVVDANLISKGQISVEIGPASQDSGARNAILNGLEILKMSNEVNSFTGDFAVDGTPGHKRHVVAAFGFAMAFGAFVGLGAMVMKWRKRPQDWQKKNSFSSWLLPLHAGGDSSFVTNSKTSIYPSTLGLGRYFSFEELKEATKNFDSNAIIGVGGFGNVYLGVIDDGTEVAVKRGNPQSEQGVNEFQAEIHILSKLRHRHLVSLIGYCDEGDEMILVYDYMSRGPFRDHLYDKNLPPLSWKQRLEICIGAASGLHYLHTGTAQGIIHRDVKTTNILLDDAFVAKVADFGLSKDAPMGQGHVSTAVKGSFGYLDPEYFRLQQLTEKSDVYSFGVVLLEALCARAAICPQLPREQVNLADWAMQNKRKDRLEKIIDPVLVDDISPESMRKFADAAERCLAEYGVDRPTMGDVLWTLGHALQLQESFEKQKSEGSNKPHTTESTPSATSQKAPTSTPATQDIDDHSESAVDPQFSTLTGR